MKKMLFGMIVAGCISGIIAIMIIGYDPGTTPACTTTGSSVRITRDFYQVCYNQKTKQPFWVLQLYNGVDANVTYTTDVQSYHPDPLIPSVDQASIQDYKTADWVLGNYLFPFSNRALERIDLSKEGPYFFSTTSPQDPGFHSGYWEKLRNYARDRAKKRKFPSYIGVLSGPLFLSENEDSNKSLKRSNQLLVPTHFFQVIIPTASEDAIEAYIVPNRKISKEVPLEHFKYDLEAFEKKTGITEVGKITRNLNVFLPGP